MSKVLNLLVAYPYLKPDVVSQIKDNANRIRFVLDSGAFTAWKAGKPIALDDYCRFIESLPIKPWRYFALDVIGRPQATLENYELMIKRGFKPIPIFTRGEAPEMLDHYYKTSDVVGIGGLVGTEQNKGFVKGIMSKVKDRKVHLLGFTNLAFLKFYKPYMCDASSWNSGARYGQCPLYIGKGQPLMRLGKDNLLKSLKDERVRSAVLRLHIDPDQLLKLDNWTGGDSLTYKIGARSMVQLSHDVGKKLGTNFFLASSSTNGVRLLLEGLI